MDRQCDLKLQFGFFLSVPRLFERMLPRGRGIGIKNGRDSAIFYICGIPVKKNI